MEKSDYGKITEQIVNHIIRIPEGLSAEQMIQWLYGYSQCQNDILEIIMRMKKEAEQIVK